MFLMLRLLKNQELLRSKLPGAPAAIGALTAMALALSVQSARASDDNTVKIGGKVGAGKVVVVVKFDDDKNPTTHSVDTTDGEASDKVAQDIADAFGTGKATLNGSTVTFKDAKVVGATGTGASAIPDHEIASLNSAGGFSFDAGFADLGPPSDSLLADATITAGFAQGLSPISITELAGTTIEQLTLDTVNALDSAGYAANLIDSHDFRVGAQGAILPDDFLLSAIPVSGSGNLGISLDAHDVPELSTWSMILLGFVGVSFVGCCASKKTAPLLV
jgi:hypothetical protein